MKQSLGRKICWIGSILIVAFVLLNVILTYFFMAPFSTLFYRGQISDFGDSLEQMNMTDGQSLKDTIDELDAIHGVKVTLIDSEKQVLYTTRAFLKPDSAYWKSSGNRSDGPAGSGRPEPRCTICPADGSWPPSETGRPG